MSDLADRDEIRIIIATGVVASVFVFITLKNANPSLPWFTFIPTSIADPYGLNTWLARDYVFLFAFATVYIGVMAATYSADTLPKSVDEERRKSIEEAFRGLSNWVYLATLFLMFGLYFFVVLRILEAFV